MLELLHAWLLFPLLLGLAAYGVALLIEEASGTRLPGALLLPLGIAGIVVVAGVFTSFGSAARATVPVVVVLALAGLYRSGRVRRPELLPALAALGVFLVFGAPVLLSGQATFLGYTKLDDTATWFAFVDQIMRDGRSIEGLPSSTYKLILQTNVGSGYPVGAFTPLGVGRGLARIDVAWAIQPYLAGCAAMLALVAWTLLKPLIASMRVRAFAAFLAAQPALLYGYAAWGGMKEVTIALLVMLAVALAVELFGQREAGVRAGLPLAVLAAALTLAAGRGGMAFILPLLGAVALAWAWPLKRATLAGAARRSGAVAALVVALPLPFIVFGAQVDYSTQFATPETDRATLFGNLYRELSFKQLAGIWPQDDFRLDSPGTITTLLLVVGVAAALGAVAWSVWRRQFGVVLYAALALTFVAAGTINDASPWLQGKTFAIAAPAVLLVAVAGAGLLWSRRRIAGGIVLGVLGFGVLWSNALAYTNVTLAPRDRLAELQTIGELVEESGPTFDNQYDVYSSRHFLRRGAPVEPAEYRSVTLPLRNGTFLIKSGFADLDAFPLDTFTPYKSIVTGAGPTLSRPPSNYREVWSGDYYRLYERDDAAPKVLRHVDFGDSDERPYCGNAQNAGPLPLCPQMPVGTPDCRQVKKLGAAAMAAGGRLVAFTRAEPIVVNGDDTQWPGKWPHDEAGHTLTALAPGTATGQIAVAEDTDYEVWLNGTFGRGLEITVDGQKLATLRQEVGTVGVRAGTVRLASGTHSFTYTYPEVSLRPGSRDRMQLTTLASVALLPMNQKPQIVDVPASQAGRLCGQTVDWIEIVQ